MEYKLVLPQKVLVPIIITFRNHYKIARTSLDCFLLPQVAYLPSSLKFLPALWFSYIFQLRFVLSSFFQSSSKELLRTALVTGTDPPPPLPALC